ncbi:MAG: 2,3-bisphosphoglycerate-independent phosphoglycerate mutase [Campylobacter sp.]|nr:2,3-bisphosphoglycerate-independent phosphoglycerate mutase [Campylobacter sp.]
MTKKMILVITDGIGHNKSSKNNAFAAAKKPTYEWLFKNTPNSLLKTSAFAVGLPKGQMGNSEVGHMTIGAGRILYQSLVKIDKELENNTLKDKKVLKELFEKHKRIHIIGLYSDGGVHSHLRHFDALYDMAVKSGCEVFAHAITDGRDVSPVSGLEFISALEKRSQIATISGRFYAMDRDKRWDRTQIAYKVIAENKNLVNLKPSKYLANSYAKDITDEFIQPASFINFGGIKSSDGVVFINFRNDRARQIVSALGEEKFSEFTRQSFCPNIVTMSVYDDKFRFPVIIENESITDTLSELISRAGLTQLHTAETEKYAHVTFFFNGGKEEPCLNETRILIPSPKVKTYDEKPEMSAYEVKDTVIKGMQSGEDFIVVNFANGDMVGHTGNFAAAVKAVEAVDECLGEILKEAKKNGYSYMQISDHGNCELMAKDGEVVTNHSTFDVYCFIVDERVKSVKDGGLSNVAATVLKLMDLEIPSQMDEPLF